MNTRLPRLVLWIVLSCLLACSGSESPGVAGSSGPDRDGDGVVAALDCNDSDGTIFPGADEVCDGVDNNCDGQVDVAAIDASAVFYVDLDGDGFGYEMLSLTACTLPDGYADNADDCDDSSAAAYPGGVEVCDGRDNDCNGVIDGPAALGAITWYLDEDGDSFGVDTETVIGCIPAEGFAASVGDCDDHDELANPGRVEECDLIDNDCDGKIDESDAVDVTTWYLDLDGDDFGTTDLSVEACDRPENYVRNPDDCDDFNEDVFPDAREICDRLDNDCNGEADDPWSEGMLTFYLDSDGDDFGDPETAVEACEVPDRHVLDGSDCDDRDPAVNELATEVCDEVDNDCDGTTDIGAVNPDIFYYDHDGDGFGTIATVTESCSQPDRYVDNHRDCDDNAIGVHPDAEELCNDYIDNDCGTTPNACRLVGVLDLDADEDDDNSTITRASVLGSGKTGYSFAFVDDVNDDLNDELLVSAHRYSSAAHNSGMVSLFYGPLVSTNNVIRGDVLISGAESENELGIRVLDGGLLNDDNRPDILIQSTRHSALYAFFSPFPSSLTTADANLTFSNSGSGVAAAASLNEDNQAAIVIGYTYGPYIPEREPGDPWHLGEANVFLAPWEAEEYMSHLDYNTKIGGWDNGGELGREIQIVGDVNDDGAEDLVIASNQHDPGEAGIAYLFLGPLFELPGADQSVFDTSAADTVFQPEQRSQGFGTRVSGANLNGDEFDDIIIGAPDFDGDEHRDTGVVYVFFGPMERVVGAESEADIIIHGVGHEDRLGSAIAGVDDFDGDGIDDLLLGARYASDTGEAYLFYGGEDFEGTYDTSDADLTLQASEAIAFGFVVAGDGDLNGDGYAEIAIGSPDWTDGRVEVLYGHGE